MYIFLLLTLECKHIYIMHIVWHAQALFLSLRISDLLTLWWQMTSIVFFSSFRCAAWWKISSHNLFFSSFSLSLSLSFTFIFMYIYDSRKRREREKKKRKQILRKKVDNIGFLFDRIRSYCLKRVQKNTSYNHRYSSSILYSFLTVKYLRWYDSSYYHVNLFLFLRPSRSGLRIEFSSHGISIFF